MRKVILILTIILGLGITSYSQDNGGLFQRGKEVKENTENGSFPVFANHGEPDEQKTPIGAGSALLIGFGAAYAMYKRNRK